MESMPEARAETAPRMAAQVVAIAVRVLLGAWFVYSGAVKVFVSGLDRFTLDISNYRLVAEPLDAVAAYTVPWFEIVAGSCLVLGLLRKGAILTLAGLVVVFAICIGWAWAHGLNIRCGCHGGQGPIHYWGKVAEFAGYGMALGGLWWFERRMEPPFGEKVANMA
jgi:uncharacterized membrane protein YphA (DoxX/SURF4 family)